MSTKLDQIDFNLINPSNDVLLVAVSGGVDSTVLLDVLARSRNKIEVAYIDHSQREDTDLDITAIKKLTSKYSLKLHIAKLDLPKGCSEQQARTARYTALYQIIKENNHLGHLVTAHHADDVLETAIINLIRGTGPRGISSLRHQPNGIWRPFLYELNYDKCQDHKKQREQNKQYITKSDILDYALAHQLSWHEDSTNKSNDYLRNRIRQRLDGSKKADKLAMLELISRNAILTEQIDQEVDSISQILQHPELDSTFQLELFYKLPEEIKEQFLHRKISHYGFDVGQQSVMRAKVFLETKTTGKILQLKGCQIKIIKNKLFTFESIKKAREKTTKA